MFDVGSAGTLEPHENVQLVVRGLRYPYMLILYFFGTLSITDITGNCKYNLTLGEFENSDMFHDTSYVCS